MDPIADGKFCGSAVTMIETDDACCLAAIIQGMGRAGNDRLWDVNSDARNRDDCNTAQTNSQTQWNTTRNGLIHGAKEQSDVPFGWGKRD